MNGTTGFTSIYVVAATDSKEEAEKVTEENFDICGGLILIIDSLNPEEEYSEIR